MSSAAINAKSLNVELPVDFSLYLYRQLGIGLEATFLLAKGCEVLILGCGV